MEAVGCTIDGGQEAKSGNEGGGMNRRDFLQTTAALVATPLRGSERNHSARPLPWVAHPNYYDDTVPREPKDIAVAPFWGERYQARVPDTLDLAEYADRATNAFTRLISPVETDYCIYHLLHKE